MIKSLLYLWMAAFAVLMWFGYAHVDSTSDSSGDLARLTDGPHVGQPAPDFTLPTLDGHAVHFADLHGKAAATRLAFFCGCDRCTAAATKIGRLQKAHKMGPFVCVVALDPGSARDWVHKTGIQGLILTDPDDTVSDSYASSFCPRLWIVEDGGRVAYRSDIALEGPALDASLNGITADFPSR